MTKIIRKTLPRDFSIGILVIIAILVFFLSPQLFEKQKLADGELINIYLTEVCVTTAVIIMILILWEELLFPVQIKPEDGGLIFRNHKRKLIIQVLFYSFIPIIVAFLFLNFEVNPFRFFVWAGVVIILPIVGKLTSGIKNYNDFLKLTPITIEYKDNEKEGSFKIEEILGIKILKNKNGDLNELELKFHSSKSVLIHIYQMELEDFFEVIEEYLVENYSELIDREFQ